MLLKGLGIEGDAHKGTTAQHRYIARRTPDAPNLRQVHLIHSELHDELAQAGFDVSAGQLGENVTTRGIDLLGLPTGTLLHLGDTAVVEVTGLRDPCALIDRFQKGLLKAVVGRDEKGKRVCKSGIMSIVLEGGMVRPGDTIRVKLPPKPHKPLVTV